LNMTLALLAMVLAAGCGDGDIVNQDVPGIDIRIDTVQPDDSTGQDNGGDRDTTDAVDDTVCVVGFGYAGTPGTVEEKYDADIAMSGTQTRDIPIFYRDCDGDDSDRLVTFELVDGAEYCELMVKNDYTDEDGIANGSVASGERGGFCHVKACSGDDPDLCVTVTIVVIPKDIPPLNVVFDTYNGNYALQLKAVKVRLIKQTEEKKVMCSDIDPRELPSGDLDSDFEAVNDIIQFTSLPGLEAEKAQDYTIIALGYEFDTEASEQNPLRAWSCDDSNGHVEWGDQTVVTMKLWDIPPSILGRWNIDSNFDLTSGLPDTVDKILDIIIGLFTSPTGELLKLLCDEKEIGINIGGEICGWIFADADDPVLGEYGMIGTFVVGIIDNIIVNLIATNCPYKDDPDRCTKIYFGVAEVGAILQKFRILSEMNCEREPTMDWANPEAGAIIQLGDCTEQWRTVIFRWTLGKDCDPTDEDCGNMYFSLGSIPGLEDAIAADISGAVIDGEYLQIDKHSVNLKYGALINFALEKILLPQVFGSNGDGTGLPAVDSYEDLLGSLLAGRQCLNGMTCCDDFAATIEAKYPGYGLGVLSEGACDALIDVAVGYLRDQLNLLDTTPENFKLGTPVDNPALMIDNDSDMHFDTIGTKMDLCTWDANLTIGSSVYDPIGLFWGQRD